MGIACYEISKNSSLIHPKKNSKSIRYNIIYPPAPKKAQCQWIITNIRIERKICTGESGFRIGELRIIDGAHYNGLNHHPIRHVLKKIKQFCKSTLLLRNSRFSQVPNFGPHLSDDLSSELVFGIH